MLSVYQSAFFSAAFLICSPQVMVSFARIATLFMAIYDNWGKLDLLRSLQEYEGLCCAVSIAF